MFGRGQRKKALEVPLSMDRPEFSGAALPTHVATPACTQLVKTNGLVTVQRFAGDASIYSTVRYVGMNPRRYEGMWKAA
jgi:hypothetical protein